MLHRAARWSTRLSFVIASGALLACSSLSGCSGSPKKEQSAEPTGPAAPVDELAAKVPALAGTYLCKLSLGQAESQGSCRLSLEGERLRFSGGDDALSLEGLVVPSQYGFQLQGKLGGSLTKSLVVDFFDQGRGHFASTTLIDESELLTVSLSSKQ